MLAAKDFPSSHMPMYSLFRYSFLVGGPCKTTRCYLVCSPTYCANRLTISFSPNSVPLAVRAFSWINCRFNRCSIGSVTGRFRSTVTRIVVDESAAAFFFCVVIVEEEEGEESGTESVVGPERGEMDWRERRDEIRADEEESSRVRYDVDEVVACSCAAHFRSQFHEVFVASGYARLVATCWKSGRPSRRVRLTCWVATVEGLITPSVMAVHIRSASVEPSGTASPPV